ncbi:hypothetical protein A9X05_17340 [Mycobacterium sp. E3298]|nr:hypothetical protein A9X05_17340 [Mycobacterium sp. E3298]
MRAIELKNWVATLTLRLGKNVKLPRNATAKIGQTSLLGSQHVELAAPPNPSPEPLRDGDTIPLKNASTYPTTEQTLASLAIVLHGGGIPNLEVLQNEVYNILNGRADQIRAFLGSLTFLPSRSVSVATQFLSSIARTVPTKTSATRTRLLSLRASVSGIWTYTV